MRLLEAARDRFPHRCNFPSRFDTLLGRLRSGPECGSPLVGLKTISEYLDHQEDPLEQRPRLQTWGGAQDLHF